MTPFGARLRALRAARGLTLKAMAEDLGLSAAYLSALEHGRRGRPAPGLVMQICGLLGLIWDDAEDLKRLALVSHPKVTLDTGGLEPTATLLVHELAEVLETLDPGEIESLRALLRAARRSARPR
ncbi:helix-turn-helix domain-containing protein [Rhodospirillum rubrum]|uniref:Transcriptional regulator, XRE family n=1 Tax=Rhodospirillum rubrum (strain ATCC 11170 / ATH 1.1.1 / DSM 467 / LMG 4362 / NCIMB 8255 / S1) TaxID=269796 RepID=Q2RNA0_RHORT|nr:helix-turn-helix domain-containing protein [Rhodospirillum rubrum]ABC24395.1 transcriptional regulator, XRE family [Rhodospirillum rubrum ATCC 11170]AEO50146.1 XRE family transcriptional regulator [Rhodospirillum rubrum F11]MBK5956115.1 transcriptional regulator [Rhodospirillum rubrum]QXG80319.1 helix-turn-helix domain-containing protein [Rhodospirillum rubrum]HAQ00844.1 XRE family transcriptional regulator [Rhodospirillum rubrum]